MEKIDPQLIRKLKSYSALAVPFVAGASVANGQIVYTDVPDTTLNKQGEIMFIDLNHDGTNDFAVRVGDTVIASTNELIRFIAATASKYNSIAGSTSSPYIYPGAFKAGDLIASKFSDNKLKWNSGSNQSMGSFFQDTKNTSKYHSYGKWLNVKDRYLGLRFLKNQSYYYGWLRMDTRVDKDTVFVTLKDYAYQSIADSGIVAGDTGSSVSAVHNFINSESVKINYFNHVVHIFSPAGLTGTMNIDVFDMEGRKLKSFTTSDKQYQFSTSDLPEGLFLVSVGQDGKHFTKKISLR